MSQSADDMMGRAFGAEIFKRRKALGWSQETLGGKAGTTKETIRNIENGHVPKLALIYRLAVALETNLWDLLPPDAEGFQPGPDDERGEDSSSKHQPLESQAA